MSDSRNFVKSIKAFVDETKANCDLVVKKGCIDLLQDIIRMSPVGNPELWQGNAPVGYTGGRFRGNWQVTFNTPAAGELERNNNNDPAGATTLKEGIEQIGKFTYGIDYIYFTNNVPYGVRLEFGHSSQAPNGIVRVAAVNATTHFENAAKEVKG